MKQLGDPDYLSALIDSGERKDLAHEQAFGHFYRDQCRRVKEAIGTVLHGSCDVGIVEDLTHDIIIKIYSALQRGLYKSGGNFNGFVWSVATNRTLNHLRDARRRQRILQERIAHEPVVSVILDGVWLGVDKERLLELISQLSESRREVLHLYFFDRLIYREIAVRLGVPMTTVTGRLSRARDALKALLEQEGLVDELVA